MCTFTLGPLDLPPISRLPTSVKLRLQALPPCSYTPFLHPPPLRLFQHTNYTFLAFCVISPFSEMTAVLPQNRLTMKLSFTPHQCFCCLRFFLIMFFTLPAVFCGSTYPTASFPFFSLAPPQTLPFRSFLSLEAPCLGFLSLCSCFNPSGCVNLQAFVLRFLAPNNARYFCPDLWHGYLFFIFFFPSKFCLGE